MDFPKETVKCIVILKNGSRKGLTCDRTCTILNKCSAHISKREYDEYLSKNKNTTDDTTN